MNTADRSLAMVDYALRRRFAFVRLQPAFKAPEFRSYLVERHAMEGSLCDRIIARLQELNTAILEDTRNFGPGFEVGHSYFCPTGREDALDDDWYREVVQYEVQPLLEEYFIDDLERARTLGQKLLA